MIRQIVLPIVFAGLAVTMDAHAASFRTGGVTAPATVSVQAPDQKTSNPFPHNTELPTVPRTAINPGKLSITGGSHQPGLNCQFCGTFSGGFDGGVGWHPG